MRSFLRGSTLPSLETELAMKGRILAGLAMIGVASTASAQTTQDVTIAVNEVSQIAISG